MKIHRLKLSSLSVIIVMMFLSCEEHIISPTAGSESTKPLIKTAEFATLKLDKVDDKNTIELEKPYIELLDRVAYFRAEIMSFSTDWQVLELNFQHRLFVDEITWDALSLNYGNSITFNKKSIAVDPNQGPKYYIYIDNYLPDGSDVPSEKQFAALPTAYQSISFGNSGDMKADEIQIPLNLSSFVYDDVLKITNQSAIENYNYKDSLVIQLSQLMNTHDIKFFIYVTYWVPETYVEYPGGSSQSGFYMAVSTTFGKEEVVDKLLLDVDELKIIKNKINEKAIELKDRFYPGTAAIIDDNFKYEMYVESYTDKQLDKIVTDKSGNNYNVILRTVKKGILNLNLFNLVQLGE